MTERPILFSGPMVRAILDGRKTQTRRMVRFAQTPTLPDDEMKAVWNDPASIALGPYGAPGNRLWVRETFNQDWTDHVIYKADGGSAVEVGWPREPKWKPSIFMPRAASRITLEVTGVRVERLQDISEKDARAEGVYAAPCFCIPYRRLWDSLNEKRGFGWKANPWVWVIEFQRTTN